jgi:hypothetical protein
VIATGVVGALSVLAALVPSARPAASFPLPVDVRADGVSAICSEDGLTYSSVVAVRVHLVNASGVVLILSRQFQAAPWLRASASLEDAEAGKFSYRFDGDEYWPGEWTTPKFGKAPDDTRFELLAPGAATERIVEAYVVSTDSPGGMEGFVSAGANYVLQTAIRTWPYLPMSDKDTQAVARRWRSSGTLVTSTFETPLVSITIPAPNGRCGSK